MFQEIRCSRILYSVRRLVSQAAAAALCNHLSRRFQFSGARDSVVFQATGFSTSCKLHMCRFSSALSFNLMERQMFQEFLGRRNFAFTNFHLVAVFISFAGDWRFRSTRGSEDSASFGRVWFCCSRGFVVGIGRSDRR